MGDKIKEDEVGRACGTYGIEEDRPEGKETLDRSGHRQKDDIDMDLKEMGWESLDCICLV
jgi:hypothetical protein